MSPPVKTRVCKDLLDCLPAKPYTQATVTTRQPIDKKELLVDLQGLSCSAICEEAIQPRPKWLKLTNG